jgi:uncharacterized protein
MRTFLCALALAAAPFILLGRAAGQPAPLVPMNFAPGQESLAFGGSILGATTKRYSFDARAGQEIEIRVTSAHRSVQFDVFAPDGSRLHRGSAAPEPGRFAGTAPGAGAYAIAVFFSPEAARRNESAAFMLDLALRGEGGAARPRNRSGNRSVNGPSFDCRRAATPVERAICASRDLSQLDSRLADIYDDALIAAGQSAAPGGLSVVTLREQQRAWEAARDACGAGREIRACVRRSYERRIAHLQMSSGAISPGPTIVYECDTGELISARFFETDPPSVRFVRRRMEHVGVAATTGPGVRYVTDDHLSFSTRGGDVFLEGAGARLNCAPR